MSYPIHQAPNGRKFVRTPDECLVDLPGLDCESRYAEIGGHGNMTML